jgi:hypothetical protein
MTSIEAPAVLEMPAGGAAGSPSRIGGWLTLLAAPTFALMALLTGVLGDGPPDVICAAAHQSPLDGMVVMYALMGAVHLAPWLKLASRRH